MIQTSELIQELRAKTGDSHKYLESLPLSQTIVDSKISKEDYALYLSLMHDVVEKLENEVYPLLTDIILDIDARKKSQNLLDDIKFTGLQKIDSTSKISFPSDISTPFALGLMYVVEGSTLGGRFILKNIETNLGYSSENGASYFNGYGPKTGSSWKNFLNFMTDYEAQNQNQDEIIKGADFAFTLIGQHLEKNYRK